MLDLSLNPSQEMRFLNLRPSEFGHTRLLRKMALLAIAIACSSAASAKIVFVNGAKTTSGDGTSWIQSYQYLRDALTNSRINDEIWVAKGTYFPDDTAGIDKEVIFGDREVSFEINGQKVYGGFVGTEATLAERNGELNPTILTGEIWPGQSVYSTFHVALVKADSTLDSLTIQNGYANGSLSWVQPIAPVFDRGGGCYVSAGKVLTLQSCTFKGNRSVETGAAIMIEGGGSDSTGKVVATKCTFDQNSITPAPLGPKKCEGAAIFGNVTAVDSKFSANLITNGTEANGGAIAGDVNATNCVFTDNKVTANLGTSPRASGGAISGDITGKNCTFTGNSSSARIAPDITGAAYGGAVRGAINAANFVFSANTGAGGNIDVAAGTGVGAGGGGALYTEEGVSSLVNCVFVKNTSGIRGGAIVGGPNSGASSLLIADCTF